MKVKLNGLTCLNGLVFLVYFLLVIALLWYIFHYKEGNQNTDVDSINKYLTEQSSNELTSNTISPGISTIDRYADPMCNANEYIYCVDGYIECADIFGTSQNALQNMTPYTSGSTLAGCGTYINKVNLSDYTTDYGDVSSNRSRGVYFDLSQCDTLNYPGKPWKVGGDDIMSFQGCYPSQKEGDKAWDALKGILNINTTEIYKKGDNVLIENDYLHTIKQTLQSDKQTSLKQILAVLDADKHDKLYKMVSNKKYYKGTIKDASTALYTVSLGIPGYAIDIPGVSNQYLLKDSLYNKLTNDYYSDLGAGSHIRPMCKSGTFTSCLANPPFIMKNGKYESTSDPMIQVYPDNPLQDVDTGAPFTSPLLGPSVEEPSSLLEYNYFKTSNNETPFIQCIADYGTNIGDDLCCGQKGKLEDTKHVCPAETPICQGYSKDSYGYCAS